MCISSSSVVSSPMATTKPWISSVTSAPTMWAPSKRPGLGVEDGLDQALVLAQRNGLAVGEEGEAADLQLEACGLGLGLGQAHARHLRVAIGAAGDLFLLHRMGVEALDLLDADHALMLGLVRQHGRACHVADGDRCPAHWCGHSRR